MTKWFLCITQINENSKLYDLFLNEGSKLPFCMRYPLLHVHEFPGSR
jgi:hypothetical protein